MAEPGGSTGPQPPRAARKAIAQLDAVQYFVVACPKDLTMYRDAVKTAGLEGKLVVKDLIELVEEALPAPPVAAGGSPAVPARSVEQASREQSNQATKREAPASRGLEPARPEGHGSPAGADGSTTHV